MQISAQPMPLSPEVIDDRVATVLEAGANITLSYDDVGNVLTISASTGGASYTDEQAQDAIGTIIADSATIDFLYDDTTPSISGFVKDNSITEPMLSLSDNTTQNSSSTKHGFLPKLSNDTAEFLRGDGTWAAPAEGSTEWTRVDTATGTLTTGLLAFWRMEETSGNRVDSVAAMALVPTGTVGAVTGKHGNAADFPGTSGNYLAISDNATLSIGAAQNFTIACWAYFDASSGDHCLVGKGNVSANYDDCEFMLWRRTGTLQFSVANGAQVTNVNSGITPATGAWYFVIGWLDASNNLLWIQVNNGTPAFIACPNDSWDSTGQFEIGRQPGWSSSPILDGRVDNVMVYKRILTADERTNLWNAGLGLDYAELGSGVAYVHPSVTTDKVLAGSLTLTATEPLESAGGIKLGNSSGTTNGVIRYSGSDIETYIGGVWRSLTTSTFLYLTDTPSSYVGNALKILRVNAAANALEFGPVLGTMAEQNANAVAITGGAVSLGGHAPTGVLDVQSSVQASDVGNAYFGARVWPVAPSGAVYYQGVRIEPATGAATSTAQFTGVLCLDQPTSSTIVAGLHSLINAGAGRYNVYAQGTANNHFGGYVGIGANPPTYPLDVTGHVRITTGHIGLGGALPDSAPSPLVIKYSAGTERGIEIRPTADTGTGAVYFMNAALSLVGSIATTSSATAYNTSSDVRLKHAVVTITDALLKLSALRPVKFRWNADGSEGEGFLAHELQRVIPHAVTGEPDEVNSDGSIKPQQVDHSKLVPWLVCGIQQLLTRVATLEAQVATLQSAGA